MVGHDFWHQGGGEVRQCNLQYSAEITAAEANEMAKAGMKEKIFFFLLAFCLTAGNAYSQDRNTLQAWSEEELKTLRSLSLSSLPPLPGDPSNIYADDPRAIALGKKLFFDKRFSANGKVSCATCHIPGSGFTDRLPSARIS
jgi:cytochrome c peroxidase